MDRPTVVTRPATFMVPLSSPSSVPSHFPPSQQQRSLPVSASSPGSNAGHVFEDLTDRQTLLEESLKRSVTLVFWYKSNCEPIRLHQEVATFPLFQLSQCTQLVVDLGIAPTAYVDAYNSHAGAWEQQTIAAVRVVESEQRVLFRIRKSLLEGLSDQECPGLADEVGMQPQSLARHMPSLTIKTPTKRNASDIEHPAAPGPACKRYRFEPYPPQQGYPASPSQYPSSSTQICLQSLSAQKPAASGRHEESAMPVGQQPPSPESAQPPTPCTPTFIHASPATLAPPAAAESTNGNTSTNTVPYQLHPPLKRWPNDYTVYEVSLGFRQMDGAVAAQPTLTQRAAFERVFGVRYVKSTVCRHRGVWRRAGKELREAFERLGTDERGAWSEFVKRVEGGTRRQGEGKARREQLQLNRQQQEQQQQQMALAIAMPMTVPMIAHGLQQVAAGAIVGTSSPLREEVPPMGSLGPPPPDLDEDALHHIHRSDSSTYNPSGSRDANDSNAGLSPESSLGSVDPSQEQ
ncbi:hypothetical protein AcW2_006912 [Taiwanofungus camphoratus]|nr:hypothetical protein AcW2_006912 [Antrodia cinnamomea]